MPCAAVEVHPFEIELKDGALEIEPLDAFEGSGHRIPTRFLPHHGSRRYNLMRMDPRVAGPRWSMRPQEIVMPCPFPGMDPYLETQPFWSDFTPGFIKALANTLLAKLLPKYDVRVEEYLYVAHQEIRLHRVRPDVTVTTQAKGSGTKSEGVAQLDVAKEELEYPDIEPRTQRHLKVIRPRTGRVVTVIEVLSPTNKQPGEDGLDAYIEKRSEFIASLSNLVEIDLLRGGERLPMVGRLPPGDYYVYIGYAQRKPRVQVIAWPWRRSLPSIPIPLLPEDGEMLVELQEVFRAAYDPSFYERRLPYREPLVPPLSLEEEVWVKQRLAEADLASH